MTLKQIVSVGWLHWLHFKRLPLFVMVEKSHQSGAQQRAGKRNVILVKFQGGFIGKDNFCRFCGRIISEFRFEFGCQCQNQKGRQSMSCGEF